MPEVIIGCCILVILCLGMFGPIVTMVIICGVGAIISSVLVFRLNKKHNRQLQIELKLLRGLSDKAAAKSDTGGH